MPVVLALTLVVSEGSWAGKEVAVLGRDKKRNGYKESLVENRYGGGIRCDDMNGSGDGGSGDEELRGMARGDNYFFLGVM
ncbi:hypothetical protein E2C01_060137 [Portunus trituberculatus]|uniref:Uncharacterized protein n=1 Tax=Portunus trituberculatus TaxID=210409 RepID=A0A5B7HB73_PORTR|nr:hypothetical protein [Portunus trituberculatus]